jgi:hypothetical protein
VYLYDGSVVSMPDTPANQADYPQPDTLKPDRGLPLARLGAVFSLACGAVLDLGICRYAGKGQSELGMMQTLLDVFRPGDVVPADRLMCAWTEMVMLIQRGIESVVGRFSGHVSSLPMLRCGRAPAGLESPAGPAQFTTCCLAAPVSGAGVSSDRGPGRGWTRAEEVIRPASPRPRPARRRPATPRSVSARRPQ